MTNEMLMLSNLNCPTCAAKLEKAAQALPGMKSARVVFGAGSLNVEYDPTVLSQDKIRALCKQMGVDVVAVVPGRSS
jgi:copper chaperone CopZ